MHAQNESPFFQCCFEHFKCGFQLRPSERSLGEVWSDEIDHCSKEFKYLNV